jgi:putative selenate reductase
VITLSLAARLRQALPEVPLSFSAGVDDCNFPDCVALGFAPVTVCTDLLKPGGYGRLSRYLANLEERMSTLGVRTIGDYVVKASGQSAETVARVVEASPLRKGLVAALASDQVDLRGALVQAGQPEAYEEVVRTAAALNTPVVAARVAANPRYRPDAQHPPRKMGSPLALFDCINCYKCLPACPNDANFVYEVTPSSIRYQDYRVESGQAVAVPGRHLEIRERQQIANFQDFCNDCGNCDTFCPENGGPYLKKPCFCSSLAAWWRLRGRDAFVVECAQDVHTMWGRIDGVEYHLEVDHGADRAVFTDGQVTLELQHGARAPLRAAVSPEAPAGHLLHVSAYLKMAALLDGVLDRSRTNPVNVSS